MNVTVFQCSFSCCLHEWCPEAWSSMLMTACERHLDTPPRQSSWYLVPRRQAIVMPKHCSRSMQKQYRYTSMILKARGYLLSSSSHVISHMLHASSPQTDRDAGTTIARANYQPLRYDTLESSHECASCFPDMLRKMCSLTAIASKQ